MLAVEALSRVDPSIGVLVDVQNTLVINALLRWGSDDIKSRFLPKLAANLIGAYALSEAGSGSDAFALTTRAAQRDGEWLLTGRKLWITNANEAGLFIVFANVNPEAGYRGITAFLVERGFAGFTVGKKEDKLGIRASSTCELLFEDCRVPEANVLGEVGKGYKVAIETLNEGRIGIGAQMLGLAQGALDHAIAYTRERKQFGKAIAEFQAVQFQLARAATEIEAARLLVYNAARLRDARPAVPHRSGDVQAVLVRSRRAHGVAGGRISSAATASRRTTRSRSSTATRRSARSTKARPTCSCRRSPKTSWGDVWPLNRPTWRQPISPTSARRSATTRRSPNGRWPRRRTTP